MGSDGAAICGIGVNFRVPYRHSANGNGRQSDHPVSSSSGKSGRSGEKRSAKQTKGQLLGFSSDERPKVGTTRRPCLNADDTRYGIERGAFRTASCGPQRSGMDPMVFATACFAIGVTKCVVPNTPTIAGPNCARAPPAVQAKYCPPLAEMVEPVMKPASSEARNTTQRAISSGSPRRPTGICGMMRSARTFSSMALTISVAM